MTDDWECIKQPIRPTYRTVTTPLRQLPDTLIIGAQKSGTTSLYNYLCQHPRIFPSSTKETHFFDGHYHKGKLWYRRHFPMLWEHEGRIVEGTTGYMFFEKVLPRIQETLTDLKLIAVLRDPVARAYSHYRHARRGMGRHEATESRPYEEAVYDDMKTAREGTLFGRVDSDHYFNDRYFSYVRRGIYAPQLRRYFSCYGDSLLVLRSRDFFERPQETISTVFEHLCLPDYSIDHAEVYNRGEYREENPLRSELETFYQPYNEELYELLEVDAWWK